MATNACGEMAMPAGTEPLARVIENLTDRVDENPDDASLQYALGRAYGMAHAWGTDVRITYWDSDAPHSQRFYDLHGELTGTLLWDIQAGEQHADPAKLAKALSHVGKALGLDPERSHVRLTYAWLHEEGAKHATTLRLPVDSSSRIDGELSTAIDELAKGDKSDHAVRTIEGRVLRAAPRLFEIRTTHK